MNHAIDFFYQHAGRVLRPFMNVESASETDRCAVCERGSDQWLYPGEKVSFVNYGATEVHCVSCHSLYEGSIELFGVERMAGGSTPVPMKLGMATGCGALVTPESTTLFLNGFIKKMGQAKNPPFKMVELSGQKAHKTVLTDPPTNKQYLYIGNFGRKKRDLVQNLKLSDSGNLVICEESEQIVVNLQAARSLLLATEQTGLKVPRKNAIKTVLRKFYTGLLTPQDDSLLTELDNIAKQEPMVWEALKTMPADPHERLNILKIW